MKRTVATRLAEKLTALADDRLLRMTKTYHCPACYSITQLRHERETLLKASVELRRLAAKKGKKKQSKVGA